MNFTTIRAFFKRDFRSYFGNPKGYVFIAIFVLSCFALAFGQDAFWTGNKANLDSLNEYFYWLLVLLVPGITMGCWAEESREGTDQLLLTLPAEDHEIVLGKFGACLGVYTVALAFTLPLIGVLEYLGDPDVRLMLSTYFGYWLLGGAMISLGMLASALSKSMTVAWLLGTLFCVLLRAPQTLEPRMVEGLLSELLNGIGVMNRFTSFGQGVVALEDVLYFVGTVTAGLYANCFLLGRRHWTIDRSRVVHGATRLASVVILGVSVVMLGGYAAARVDVTAEQMLSLTPEARKILAGLNADRPVYVQAWISPQVPESYRATREGLVRMLREFDARAGNKLQVAVYETEPYSEEAEQAETSFGIKPEQVESVAGGRRSVEDIFLGLVFTCGMRELKIPFFDRGLPIQYELTRAIGAVAQVERSKVGILTTGAEVFGSFDFQSMNRSEDWQVLEDLRKQYEVTKVEGTAPIDTSLDVLVVPLPSSLSQPKLDRLARYLYDGGKALLLCDPYPEFNINLAPTRPAGGQRNIFQQQRQPPSEPKGNIEALLNGLGVSWAKDRIVWDDYNPHPNWSSVPRELVFVAPSPGDGRPSGFNEEDPITSGLQEVVLIFGGALEILPGRADIQATPLLSTGTVSGTHSWRDMVADSFFGITPKPPESRRYTSEGKRQDLAIKLRGKLRAPSDAEGMKRGDLASQEFEVIVVADMDLISDVFYSLRRRGTTDLTLDNVTFIANCIDALAGEESYIKLRKLRPKHRTLTRMEALEQIQGEKQREALKKAREHSEKQLAEAQERLDDRIEKIEKRTDLDPRQKQILLETARAAEQKKLDKAERRVKDAERKAIRLSETEKVRAIRAKQDGTILVGAILMVLPVVLLGLGVWVRKESLERAGSDPDRRR